MNKRLKEIRMKLKLNQEEFAGRIGITQGQFCTIETGKLPLTDRNIKLVCLIFDVNEEWLRSGEGNMFNTPIEAKNDEEKELIRMFRKVSAETKQIILNVIQKFLAADGLQAVNSAKPAEILHSFEETSGQQPDIEQEDSKKTAQGA